MAGQVQGALSRDKGRHLNRVYKISIRRMGMKAVLAFAFLVLLAHASAFSILDYRTEATVLEDGSLAIYERMVFDLDQEYSEGYRSIRKEDFNSLSDITVNSVKVNGADAPWLTVMNGDQAEIIWRKTYVGENVVELDYVISDRVQLYNDFAKVCYEHYGANWPVRANRFSAKTTMPAAAAGETMHFEVYSAMKGEAYVDDLSVVIEIANVPSGNYVGGCYLFDRDSVATDNTVDASAYAILKEEREIYGSQTVLEPETANAEWCCIPLFFMSLLMAASLFLNDRKRPRLPETILPPGKDDPAVVSALVRNRYKTRELLAAVVVDLINRGVIDIVELEKKGAKLGPELKKERTILMLKKGRTGLKNYERSVLDLIFAEGNEVDLDAMMAKYDKVKGRSEAKKLKIVSRIKAFRGKFPDQVTKYVDADKEIQKLSDGAQVRLNMLIAWCVFLFVGFMFSLSIINFDFEWYTLHGEEIMLMAVLISTAGFLAAGAYSASVFLKAEVPRKEKNRELYARWDAFYRGLQSSRINEYPPASAVIWGEILRYATALGRAKKVKKHLSELDSALAHRVQVMDNVALSTMAYYSSAIAVCNLSRYGNRSGRSSSGSFSSASSGGWSGGGGGFSGGSSGGGGFR
ncbi:TPA: DUF2207 domain-containing protein [Candidatus Micrarchaeota archaeon]|nr:DUF2207 domain-containing protein [Candidatus Micrarchaeota archaeon]